MARELTTAVILAAGLGSRFGRRTDNLPKCLIEVGGVPILVNALQHLETQGVRDAVLVVGYQEQAVRQRIGSRLGALRVAYRVNDAYRATNTSTSLQIGLEGVTGAVLILEGDVFFEGALLHDAVNSTHPDVTVVERWHPAIDGSVVELDDDGQVTAWIHRKDRPPGLVLERTWKTVNVHRFSPAFVSQWVRPAVDSVVAASHGREPLETVFDSMVRRGAVVHALPAAGAWMELDDEADLQRAEELFGRGAR